MGARFWCKVGACANWVPDSGANWVPGAGAGANWVPVSGANWVPGAGAGANWVPVSGANWVPGASFWCKLGAGCRCKLGARFWNTGSWEPVVTNMKNMKMGSGPCINAPVIFVLRSQVIELITLINH